MKVNESIFGVFSHIVISGKIQITLGAFESLIGYMKSESYDINLASIDLFEVIFLSFEIGQSAEILGKS